MNKLIYSAGEMLTNIVNKDRWKIIMIDDEHNQLIISNEDKGMMVVNITNLEVDYKKDGE